MQLRASYLALSATLLSACFHVDLAGPGPTAPLAQRITAYQRLRPANVDREVTIVTNNSGTSVTVESTLTLADGTSVTHADDLLPLLDPNTPAARAARESESARTGKWISYVAGTAIAAGGLIYALGGQNDDPYAELDRTRFNLGLGAVAVGSIAILVGQFYFRPKEERLRRSAFFTFDESLRSSLKLCVSGMNLVDCQATQYIGPPGALQPAP